MSTFNMTKNTSSKIKDLSLALILTGSLIGATLSTSVNAAPATSVENAVSNFIVAQGEKMITELNAQLQQSIDNEIKKLSDNFSLNNATTWLTTEQKVKQVKPSANKKDIHSLPLTSN
jgi:hypothetical protein